MKTAVNISIDNIESAIRYIWQNGFDEYIDTISFQSDINRAVANIDAKIKDKFQLLWETGLFSEDFMDELEELEQKVSSEYFNRMAKKAKEKALKSIFGITEKGAE